MDRLNTVISENLKKLREERRLSLDNVAKLTGVSKSMLGQIERGEVNPTVSTVWRITNGLKISFTQLMSRPETDIELVLKDQVQTLSEDGGRVRNHPLFPFDVARRFETYSLEIDSGGRLGADAHPSDTQEFITVFSGVVTIVLNEAEFSVKAGDSIRFRADIPHQYRNDGDITCIMGMVIYYP